MNYEIQLRPRRKRRWPTALVIVVVVAAALGGAYLIIERGYFGLGGSRVTHHVSRLYHCPMHPSYTSDKPGTCPICGMTLVPMEGAEPHDMDRMKTEPPGRAPVTVTPTQRQMIGVTTARAEVREITKEIRTVGTVAFDPKLAVAQEEFLTARRLGDRSLAKAGEERLQLMGMGTDQIRQLARTGRIQKNLYLPAPGGKAWIYGMIYEVDIPYIAQGQPVEVRIPDNDTIVLAGTIAAIDPVIDHMTRTAMVRSEVDDSQGLLKPNLYVDVFIRRPLGRVLAIPANALLWSDKASFVFVDEGKGRLVPRTVVVGGRTDDFVEILDGLTEGEKVVSSVSFLIDAESQLKATLRSMTEEGGKGMMGGHGGHVH